VRNPQSALQFLQTTSLFANKDPIAGMEKTHAQIRNEIAELEVEKQRLLDEPGKKPLKLSLNRWKRITGLRKRILGLKAKLV
jgi:hypothetical protein